MEHYILQEHWSSLVRRFKDEEKQAYEAEQTATAILDFIRYTRFRQYNLFTQKRGEEFERLIQLTGERGARFIEDDERWSVALEVAEQ